MNKHRLLLGLVFAALVALLFCVDPSFERTDTSRAASLDSAAIRPDALEAGLPSEPASDSDIAREPLADEVAAAASVQVAPAIDTDERAGLLDAPLLTDAEYQELYEEMSASALEVEYEALNEEVQQIAAEAYRSYFDTGRYEVVGYSTELSSVMQDRNKLMAYQVVPLPGQEVPEIRRVELIEEEYPETYSLHRRAILALDTLMEKQRSLRR
jgi:hypothetical protein